MNREHKSVVVKELSDGFSQSQASFIVTCKGLTVSQIEGLRTGLREQGGSFRVAKARLIKRAVDGVDGVDQLGPFLKEQIGVVFASDEAPAVAKILHDFAKQNEEFQLVVGCLDKSLLDAGAIKRIATLPSKEVLLAQVCGTLNAPISGFVNVLSILILRLLWTLKRIEEKKQA